MSAPVIALSGITKTYEGEGDAEVHALSGIDLDIFAGEYVALMGPSGSGKSTLMHILGCLDQPTSGRYLLGGDDVSQLAEDELAQIRNERIGFVFQAFNLLARTSAQKNVELPLAYRGLGLRQRAERARDALTRVGLGDKLLHKPSELSGGQKQRVAIARALVQDPQVLLADEPTGNLDSKSTHDILGLFDELHREGRTIILVTHEEEVGARATRTIWLRDGLISDGRPVLESPLEATSMNLLENLQTAFSAIASNKLRSLLTMLGVIIGVFAVTTMLSLGQMATQAITKQLDSIGGRTLFVQQDFSSGRASPRFTQDDVDALSSLPITNISSVFTGVQASAGGKTVSLNAQGVAASYPENARTVTLQSGRFFTDAEARGAAPVIVILSTTASKLFPSQNPIGKTVRLEPGQFPGRQR